MKRIPIFLLILFLLQGLLVPKYQTGSPEGGLTGDYYRFAGDNDVLLLGDCEVYENFSPVALWQEFGIPSAIRGSAQQTIWHSYHLLAEALEYETPKVVVFNVLAMQYDTPESTGNLTRREAYDRMTLDTMAWSGHKLGAILSSGADVETLLSYLFPLLRYHDRWQELGAEDVSCWFRREPVSHNGYLMQTGIRPMTEAYPAKPLADYRFGENSWAYLDKIRLLCQEKGVTLVLIKAPVLYPVWWPEWETQIAQYAETYSLPYWNMTEHWAEMGIDWTRDTYDAGLHLNVWGAEKATAWLGRQLRDTLDLPDRRSEPELAALWTEKTERYEKEKTQ